MDISRGKEIVLDAGNKLLAKGLVAGTWGNISLKISENQMVVTPSGKNYETLTTEDIVVMNIDSHEYIGDIKPSSESKLHAALYRLRPDIRAIIHTHSNYASIVAAARKSLSLKGCKAQELIGDHIPITKYAVSSTKGLEKNVLKAIGDKNAVLLANHGAFCVGHDMDIAFKTCDMMEQACKAYIDNNKQSSKDGE